MSDKAKETEEDFTGFKCPVCKDGDVAVKKAEYDLPDKDKVLIIKFECNKCNFHQNDIIPLTTRTESGIMTLRITNEEDLKSKVYRSPTSKLEIPELELQVEPGPSAGFYYTNIEGILFRFEDAAKIYYKSLNDDDPEKKIVADVLKDLQKAMNAEFEFTLKITDAHGGSYIIPVDKSKYSFEKTNSNSKDNV